MFAHRLRKTLGAGVNNFYRDEHFTPVIGARRATFRGLKRDFAELIRPRQESSNRTGLECCTAIQIPLLDVAQADSLHELGLRYCIGDGYGYEEKADRTKSWFE